MTLETQITAGFNAVAVDIKTITNKLNGIEAGATGDQTGSEIAALYEALANVNRFTDSEKAKLASLEGSKFLGTYTSKSALDTAHPSPAVGSYAHVDAGAGSDAKVYIWDDNSSKFVEQAGASVAETAASIKSKYESNGNTNAFTDAHQTKLNGIESGATADQTPAEIAASYESVSGVNRYTTADKNKVADIGNTAANFAGSYAATRDSA